MLMSFGGAWARPPRAELLSNPRYVQDGREPAFVTIAARSLPRRIKVVSGRNSAVIGFNTPEVVLWLPAVANSAYALVRFDTPRPVDGRGKGVDFELEAGAYDDATFSDRIRLPGRGGEGAADFARVSGSGTIRYPLEVTTRIVRKKGGSGENSGVRIDGPFVTYIDRNPPDMEFLTTSIGPVRAYDDRGRRLRRHTYSGTETVNSVTRRTLAFRGRVAEVHIDTVTRWAEIAFTYDLPPAKPLPESFTGRPPARPPRLADTPGGRVRVRLVEPGKKTGPPAKPAPSAGPAAVRGNGIALATAMAIYPEADILKLIARGVDVNKQDRLGRTPLLMAVYRHASLRVFGALVAAGARVNIASGDGQTPLKLARAMHYDEIVRFLTAHGAKQ